MKTMPFHRYKPYETVALPDRTWPDQRITTAPIWCSVDLRDGNQALIEPMDTLRKKRLFTTLVDMGFKEIEVGFPAASQTDFDFVRLLIDENLIPNDVTIQVLTQAREHLIRRTFDSLKGAKSAIVHLYNSTSELQRRVVFGKDKAGIVKIATDGATLISELVDSLPETKITHQYSPESFTGTEMDFAIEICEAVMDVYKPTPDNKMILNLPATVEMSTPNLHADQIEWFCHTLSNRESAIISLHPHNDRGTAVAAAELALMAGADRVEGTLFGNGERTGNIDLVTLALNLMTQGVDPQLDIHNINDLKQTAEFCTQLPIHPRHPWVGDLVYTAFSGSHQDAIKKGMDAVQSTAQSTNSDLWAVPYLPIDPEDIGRDYEAIVRINSQSGKGGVAYIMKTEHQMDLPRALQIDFSKRIQAIAEATGNEITSHVIYDTFRAAYMKETAPLRFIDHTTVPDAQVAELRHLSANLVINGEERRLSGSGNGPIAAFIDALDKGLGLRLSVKDYTQHTLADQTDAQAVAYLRLATVHGDDLWGVGVNSNTTVASIKALIGAANQIIGRTL